MMFKKILPILLLAFAMQLTAQNLIPREELFQEKEKFNVRIALRGDYVFFQQEENGADGSIYSLRTDVVAQPSELHLGDELIDWRPTYSHEIVAIVKNGEETQLVKAGVRSKKAKVVPLKPFKNIKFLHFSPKFMNKIAVEIEGKEKADSGLFIVDIISGNMKRIGRENGFDKILFDDLFTQIAAQKKNEIGGNSIFLRTNSKWDTLAVYPDTWDMYVGGFNQILSVTNDGKKMYMTDNSTTDKVALYEVDVASGELTELAKDEFADILPYGATFNANGKPTAVLALFADSRRHFTDAEVKKDFEFLQGKLGNVKWVGATQNDNTWLIGEMKGGPVRYHVFNRKNKEVKYLFNDYSFLERYTLAERKAHAIKVRNDITLPVHVYLPVGTDEDGDGIPTEPLPTVVFMHGGPWVGIRQWNQWNYLRHFQLLANRGYAVINIEFRGTTGLGKKVHELGKQQWGEGMNLDIADITDWATKQGIADPRKVGLLGWSYGGYAAAAGLAFNPRAYACGVNMFGPTDLLEFVKSNRDTEKWHDLVGNPHTPEGEALLKKHSPNYAIDNIASPILLTAGGKDERVPQSQLDNFAKLLNEKNKDIIYFTYPEEGHTFMDTGSWISFWAITEAFLKEHLGGRAEVRNDAVEQGNIKVVLGGKFIEEMR
jgi:dipeptidyl aminopeptidase/acylaminoacyl peptidase